MGQNVESDHVKNDCAVTPPISCLRTCIIVNPCSRGARTGGIWPLIETEVRHIFGPVEVTFTDGPMAAKRLASEAIKKGIEQIVAIGGDGTVNEVINGFFEQDEPINPKTVLAALTSGTGRDFRRTFNMPEDIGAQIDRVAASKIHPIDVGKLTYTTEKGKKETRYFGNVASFGLSGATDRAVNQLKYAKRLGGRFAFKWGMIKSLLRYRNQRVRIRVDDFYDEELDISTAAVCNGQYFGSGMRIAPDAAPDDGLFDVVIVAGIGVLKLLWNINSIYKGEHIAMDQVKVVRGKKVVATPANDADEILLDVDGESPGRLPATFEILPGVIQFRG